MDNAEFTPITPYMVRAWHEWCSDNGLTPYLSVKVDNTVAVPREFVKDGEIVLNIGMDATGALHLGNDDIRFKARFSGRVRDITVPMNRVQAIFARENGMGMSFEVFDEAGVQQDAQEAGFADDDTASKPANPVSEPPKTGGGLKLVK